MDGFISNIRRAWLTLLVAALSEYLTWYLFLQDYKWSTKRAYWKVYFILTCKLCYELILWLLLFYYLLHLIAKFLL